MLKLDTINLIVLLDKIVNYIRFQEALCVKEFCYGLLKLYQTHFFKTHYDISMS